VLAQSLENAARLAMADLQGVQIDLRVYGTAGNPEQARTAGLQAVSDGAKIILGPVYAESANAVAVALAQQNINVLSFSNNPIIARGNGNLFILGHTFENAADRLVHLAIERGKSRFMVIHSTDLSGQLGLQAVEKAVLANGGTLVGAVAHEFSQNGVLRAVPEAVQMAREMAPDAVFLTANTAGALPLFSQMLPEAGLSPVDIQFIGLSRWDIPAQTLALPGVQGGWFARPDTATSAQFRARYKEAYAGDAHPIGGLAYDGIAAIGALAGSGTSLGAAGLTQSAGFQGTGGIFRFNSDGTNERGLSVAQVVDSQALEIDPAPRSFGAMGF
jgi:ABC-type branched-subunit amino acid transport system substrate-binding protein